MNWETKRLEEVCNFVRGLTYSKKDEVQESKNAVLRATNIDLKSNTLNLEDIRYISDSVKIKEEKKVRKNDILICTASGSKSHLGKVALIKEELDFSFGGFMAVLRCENEIYSPYLFKILISENFKNHLSKLSDGANINNLKFDLIKDFPIVVPPLAEQQRIAEKLDKVFADIDRAMSATEKNIEHAEALFQSFINEIFRDIEKQGNIKPLSEVCKIVNGGTPKSKIEDYWDGDIPWITPKDMGKINTKFVKDTERKITKLGLDKSSAKLIDENSVILSSRAPIGHLNINEVKMAFNQGCKGIVPGKKLDNNYLYYFLLKSKKLLNDMGSGTTFKELSSTKLKSLNIPVVDLEIQKILANKCDQLIFQTNEIKAIKKKKLSQLNFLKSSILNQAFSGELTKDSA